MTRAYIVIALAVCWSLVELASYFVFRKPPNFNGVMYAVIGLVAGALVFP